MFYVFITTVPTAYPPNLVGFSPASTKIYLSWHDIPVADRNGKLLGYKVKYKKYFDPEWMTKIVGFGFKSCTLEGLQPFTLYWVDVLAFNDAGEGPPDYAIVKTLEGGKCGQYLTFI